MPKIIFNPSEVAKAADVNYNFANTWNGTFMDDESIGYRHLSPEARGVTGSVIAFAGPVANIPSGWFLCNGQQLSRSVNNQLFAAIGTAYGAPDANTFQVPNLLGKVIAGVDANQGEFDTLGEVFGEKYHQLTEGEMPNHGHGVYDGGHQHGSQRNFFADAGGAGNLSTGNLGNRFMQGQSNVQTNTSGANIGIYATGGNQAHNNIQPTMALNYIIKG